MRALVRTLLSCGIALAILASGAKASPLADLRQAIARGEFPNTTSVVIVRGEHIETEAYFGAGRGERLADTRSAMKAITALSVGAAIADGGIPSAEALAFPFLSDLRPFQNDTPDKEAITLADMMSMSSALDCNDNDEASPGNEDRMHEQRNWSRWSVDLPTMTGYARDASGRGPWRYCTVNSVLVGQIVQRAERMRFDQYVARRLFAPLGINHWEWPRSPSGEIMTGGGLRLRSRDIATIAAMMANNGRWHGRQVLPRDWIDTMLTVRRQSRPDQNYGYFIFQGDYSTPCGPITAWYMAGNGGSQILILRPLGVAIVVTRANYNVPGTSLQTVELLQRFVLPSIICGIHSRSP